METTQSTYPQPQVSPQAVNPSNMNVEQNQNIAQQPADVTPNSQPAQQTTLENDSLAQENNQIEQQSPSKTIKFLSYCFSLLAITFGMGSYVVPAIVIILNNGFASAFPQGSVMNFSFLVDFFPWQFFIMTVFSILSAIWFAYLAYLIKDGSKKSWNISVFSIIALLVISYVVTTYTAQSVSTAWGII